MSNRKQRLVPLALSGILFVVYTVTLVVWLLQGTPVVFLDFLATYGVWLLLTVAALWLPTPYYVASMLFAFVAQYGGMVWDCYNRFSWFDVAVHFCSGILLTVWGFFLYRLVTGRRRGLPVLLPTLFATFFSVACAAIWEIYEFTIDTLFGYDAQILGNFDTMTDIVSGSLGGLLAGVCLLFLLWSRNIRP